MLLAAVAGLAVAAPVRPAGLCDRPVYLFGDSSLLARGVRASGSADLPARMKVFFRRVCGDGIKVETIARDGGRLGDDVDAIAERLARTVPSIAIVHYPTSDIEAGASVDELLRAYSRMVQACASSVSICVVGGQLPVNSFTRAANDRQIELESRASYGLGSNYLPLHRHFESESGTRRLMMPLDSGDGRLVNDAGHATLFELYRRRLIELADPGMRR